MGSAGAALWSPTDQLVRSYDFFKWVFNLLNLKYKKRVAEELVFERSKTVSRNRVHSMIINGDITCSDLDSNRFICGSVL